MQKHEENLEIKRQQRKETLAKMAWQVKVSKEEKEEAVQVALAGGDVLGYLSDRGSINPETMWRKIRSDLEILNPDVYAKLPERYKRMKGVAAK